MLIKILMTSSLSIASLLLSPNVLACFNNAGCPTGSACVKTGNLLGVCMSQAGLVTPLAPTSSVTTTVSPGVTPVAAASTTTTVSTNPTATTTTAPTTSPGATTTVNPAPLPVSQQSSTTTTVTTTGASAIPTTPAPFMPQSVVNPQPRTAGPCTNDINCPSGFACLRPGGRFIGICTQIAQ